MVNFNEHMRLGRFVLLCCLGILTVSKSSWSKGRKPPFGSYPSYEQNVPEDTPLKELTPPAPEPTPNTNAKPSPEGVPAQGPEPIPVPTSKGSSTPLEERPEQNVATSPTPLQFPDHYTVWIWQENGDCLWRIAEKVYGDRSKWRLIYLANRDVVRDPNKIYPKQKLKIPPPDFDGHQKSPSE